MCNERNRAIELQHCKKTLMNGLVVQKKRRWDKGCCDKWMAVKRGGRVVLVRCYWMDGHTNGVNRSRSAEQPTTDGIMTEGPDTIT